MSVGAARARAAVVVFVFVVVAVVVVVTPGRKVLVPGGWGWQRCCGGGRARSGGARGEKCVKARAKLPDAGLGVKPN